MNRLVPQPLVRALAAHPALYAPLEALAILLAVMAFGFGWAWVASPGEADREAYPAASMARLLPADPGVPAPPSPPTPPSGEPRPAGTRAPEAGTTAPPSGRQPGEAPAVDEWLVDGFNLLHTVLLGGEERSRWWTREMRMRVLREVAAVRAATDGAPAIVVFDGSGEPGPDEAAHGPGVRVVFAKPADAWLIARVRSARHPERIALVSADRQLASRARHRGARIVSPREFLGRGARA